MPVIEGSTHDEFTIFEVLYVESLVGQVTPFLYPIVVNVLDSTIGLAPTAEQILAQYPVTAYPSAGEAVAAIATDAIFACPSAPDCRVAVEVRASYQYELDDPNVPQVFIPPGTSRSGAITPQTCSTCSTRTCGAATLRSLRIRKRSRPRW